MTNRKPPQTFDEMTEGFEYRERDTGDNNLNLLTRMGDKVYMTTIRRYGKDFNKTFLPEEYNSWRCQIARLANQIGEKNDWE